MCLSYCWGQRASAIHYVYSKSSVAKILFYVVVCCTHYEKLFLTGLTPYQARQWVQRTELQEKEEGKDEKGAEKLIIKNSKIKGHD